MSAIGSIVMVAFLAVLAFTIYYQVILRVLHIELRAREIHTILTPDGWRIRLFRYRKGGTSGEPVLLVHGYTANHWNLTLPQGESLADFLAERGYDCWAIDLRGNRTSLPPPGTPRHRATYDGYVMEDLPTAIGFIRQNTGYGQVHWVGHSMGGMLLYAYELAHGRQYLASGTTIASPPWLEAFWTKTQDRLVWLMETIPWLFEVGKRAIAPIYAWLKPNYRLVPVRWENLNPKYGVAEFFNTAEQTPGPVTRTLEDFAKHRYLAVNNDKVNVLQGLNRIETPLLAMACPLDPIAPVSNVRAFFDHLATDDKRFLELSKAAGCEMDHSHVDPPFAKNADKEVFKPILDWIAAHPARRAGESAPPARAVATPPAAEASPEETHPAAVAPDSGGGTLWGKALKDAASILSGLNESQTGVDAATPVAPRVAVQKPVTKSRAVKPARVAKSGPKRRATTKARKASSKTATKAEKTPTPAKGQKRSPEIRARRDEATMANGAAHGPVKMRKRSRKAKATRKRTAKEPE